MSAFIVRPLTLNRVVSAIQLYDRDGHTFTVAPHMQPKKGEQIADAIGRSLWEMNAAAYRARYGEEVTLPDYTHQIQSVTRLQAHKSACCLRYQCTEGDVDTGPLYAELTKFIDLLAEQIVTELPDWERAEWG